jgi:RecB family exonuclease
VRTQLAQNVGNLIHDIAKDLPAATEPELAAELARRWPELGLPPGWVTDQQWTRAQDMVVRLAAYYLRARADGRSLVDVERPVSVAVGRAVVSGRVDRLERTADGEQYIVDLKTGRTQVSDDDVAVNPQLAVYQLAVQAGGFEGGEPVSAGGELVMLGVDRKQLPLKRQPPLPADEGGQPSWARELLDRVADGMADASYVAAQGPHCRSCPVRTSCPVQPEGRGVTT